MTLSVQANTLTTWLGPSDGSPISRAPTELANFLVPLAITRTMGYGGGDSLDHASMMYNLAATGERVVNLATPTGFNRQVEIHWELPGGGFTPIFWGDLTGQVVAVGRSESVNVTAAVYPYHFGQRLEGMLFYDVRADADSHVAEPVEFNPMIDGVIEPNMSSKTTADGRHYWGDPESFRTTKAQTYQGATLAPWTVKDAVKTICNECNFAEDFIKNPTSFPAAIDDLDTLRNVTMPYGEYLPYYLDALLQPHGFDWYVQLSASGNGSEREIAIVERGVGTLKSLKQQPPGQELNLVSNPPYTDTEDFSVRTDIAGAITECQVYGGHKQFEVTVELYRGWEEADDDLRESDLAISDPDSQYYSGKAAVWRLWVANEAGDYNELRTGGVDPIPNEPDDWSSIGVNVARRRRFEDCLAFEDDGFTRRMPFVEYTDDGGYTWRPVPPEWSYYILDTECGIYFRGDKPPSPLITGTDDAGIRVTATITGDARVEHLASDTAGNSPNGRTHRMTVKMPDAFQFRKQVTSGNLRSVLDSEDADEVDDTLNLQSFAEASRDREVSAMVDGRYSLVGVRFDYFLSDVLNKIAGREISLNRNASGGSVSKFPQVTGVTWEPQAQRTRLMTEAYNQTWYHERNRPGETRYVREI